MMYAKMPRLLLVCVLDICLSQGFLTSFPRRTTYSAVTHQNELFPDITFDSNFPGSRTHRRVPIHWTYNPLIANFDKYYKELMDRKPQESLSPQPRTSIAFVPFGTGHSLFTKKSFDKTLHADKRAHREELVVGYNPIMRNGVQRALNVPRQLQRQFPYNTAVRLSCGCTGTLISADYVITSASCVHNGYTLKQNVQSLKVESPDTMSYKIYYVDDIHVPSRFKIVTGLSSIERAAYDYAILHLSSPASWSRDFIKLTTVDETRMNSKPIFRYIGFSQKDDFSMWHVTCPARSTAMAMTKNIILNQCQMTEGLTGAAVFMGDIRSGFKMVGLASNSVFPIDGNNFNIFVALTKDKLADICNYVDPFQNSVCKDLY